MNANAALFGDWGNFSRGRLATVRIDARILHAPAKIGNVACNRMKALPHSFSVKHQCSGNALQIVQQLRLLPNLGIHHG